MAHLPVEYLVHVVQEPMVLHRTCFGADARAVEAGLMSNYEARRQPPHPADLHATILHMAVSMFEDWSKLEAMARRRPERLGTHIMTVHLQAAQAFCVADTASKGHWSVWGVPAQLAALVTDVREVR
jgi:hypothetical protein